MQDTFKTKFNKNLDEHEDGPIKNDVNLPPKAKKVPKHSRTPREPLHQTVKIVINRQKLHISKAQINLMLSRYKLQDDKKNKTKQNKTKQNNNNKKTNKRKKRTCLSY